jgi:hypothetical protein
LEGTSTFHAQVLQWVFCRIWRLVNFFGCVQYFWKVGTSSCTLWGQYYEASLTFKASTSSSCANQIITFFFKD